MLHELCPAMHVQYPLPDIGILQLWPMGARSEPRQSARHARRHGQGIRGAHEGTVVANIHGPIRCAAPLQGGHGAVCPAVFGVPATRFERAARVLVDGLHEDLNRVKKKPYVEAKDDDGRPDEEVANEQWAGHRARNDSIIVDMFQGQYKSRVQCSVCQGVSLTFDPYMVVTCPFPRHPACTHSTNALTALSPKNIWVQMTPSIAVSASSTKKPAKRWTFGVCRKCS
ncbi:hypothetical protein BCR44DRAFT_1527571 [Catenaria anguillulae PL171]|uniref:Peptidase C19 ubiquitin carboxyl-terminal hydrolase domain-containing protein n=1 Tax=Catenaria anguillulae PL171 TaxID=765915 RepID=A0A1Y2I1Q5_9FUNG|nr:hypothetical protein BCR44DRAFT_1527571 [Catenaria anguillulae PL171]